MKRNIIFIVIDSLTYDKIVDNKYGNILAPFINSQLKNSLFATNMYSQGPFTEAGNKALLTGTDSLDNGGYMHNLNQSENIYLDVFKSAGYDTYDFILPYYLYTQKHFEKIDYQLFTSDFLFISVWDYRLKYFSELFATRELEDAEWRDVIFQLELTFQAWLNFLIQKDNDKRYILIEKLCRNYDWEKNLSLLNKEYHKFELSKIEYARGVLMRGEKHELFQIDKLNYSDFIDESFLKESFYSHKVISQIKWKQFYFNLKNNKIKWRKLFLSTVNCLRNRTLDGYLKQLVFILSCGKFVDRFNRKHFYKSLPSARKMFRTVLDLIQNREKDVPFMIHLHPEDLHNRTSFFSYDIIDAELIRYELDNYATYVNSLNSSYQGEIIYDLGVLYIDDCLRELYGNLVKEGVLENTSIVITADHGYSYNCTPLRDTFINNIHTENYHIPFIIIDSSINNKVVESYHSSKDILPTIYELCGIEKPLNLKGTSCLHEDSISQYAISEYMGPGCPDMRLRPIIFIIRDSDYLLSYNVHVNENFEDGQITYIYNLREDHTEEKNLVAYSYDKIHIQMMLSHLKKRFDSLKLNF